MKPVLTHPVLDLADRLRSAVRTGRKLHLHPEHVRVLMSEAIYHAISALEAEEIRKACAAATTNDNSSEISGSGSVLTSAAGQYAGSNVFPMDAASRGASLLLREEAALMRRRKKPSTH